jgi:hypothetical protein
MNNENKYLLLAVLLTIAAVAALGFTLGHLAGLSEVANTAIAGIVAFFAALPFALEGTAQETATAAAEHKDIRWANFVCKLRNRQTSGGRRSLIREARVRRSWGLA